MLDLLSERYGESGLCDAFIIGRNVNLFSEYYAGGPDSEAGIKNYLSAVRAAYNILLSHTPDGKVYLAVSNNWNVASVGTYNVRDMLSAFNNLAGAESDFFWQVSIEANASDASDSSIWDDALAIERSEFISPANIETLSNHLASRAYTCRGMQRHILVNRLAIGGGNAEEQAASYAYAYYKSLNADSVDAVIYGVLADTDELKNGVYATNELGERTEKKLTEVFLGIDGKNAVDLSFVSKYASGWKYLYKSNSKQAVRFEDVKSKNLNGYRNDEAFAVADMSKGDMLGFAPLTDGAYAELRYSYALERPALYIGTDRVGDAEIFGAVSDTITLESLKEGDALEIFTMMSASSGSGRLTLRIVGLDKNGVECVYSSSADIGSNEWNYYYFDVSDFVKNAESETVLLSVAVESTDPSAEIRGFWLSEINMVSEKSGSLGVIFVILGIIAAAGGITAFVLWFKKNYVFVKE